jgi:hypothetical protein
MGWLLAVILICALFLLPAPSGCSDATHQAAPGFLANRGLYALLLVFGATGGLISAIIDHEPVETKASEYYIYRRTLYLRPLVGAALALVIYIAMISKLLVLLPSDNSGLARRKRKAINSHQLGAADRARPHRTDTAQNVPRQD